MPSTSLSCFKILFFLIITFSATPLFENSSKVFTIVWNVGQGQWVTALRNDQCLHFDVGGEHFPWTEISKLCRHKLNKLFLSHWDWDHIGALARWPLPSTCMALTPLGHSNAKKTTLTEKIKSCSDTPLHENPRLKNSDLNIWSPEIRTSKDSSAKNFFLNQKGKTKRNKWLQQIKPPQDSNATSHVVKFQDFLMPGDSPKEQELSWSKEKWLLQTRVLILGHHGSHTSTSAELIKALPYLKMAVASAKWSRYHHPHAETIALLKQNHISLLKTEDWGNIWFEQ